MKKFKKVLEYLEFTQLSNKIGGGYIRYVVLEYLEFTQLSNDLYLASAFSFVLEYLEFTQLSNLLRHVCLRFISFRVLGIYTALKHAMAGGIGGKSFRVLGIYTALKRTP